jgi:hypothetical protein
MNYTEHTTRDTPHATVARLYWTAREQGQRVGWSIVPDGDDFDFDIPVTFAETDFYRIRIYAPTVTINGIECVRGITEAPKAGTAIYVSDVGGSDGYFRFHWDDGQAHNRWLSYGIVHLSPEPAAAMGIAMRAFGGAQ